MKAEKYIDWAKQELEDARDYRKAYRELLLKYGKLLAQIYLTDEERERIKC